MIFGKEPAAIAAAINALLGMLLATGFFGDGLSNERIGLIMAVVTAVLAFIVAVLTHETLLAVTIGVINASVAVFVGYGLNVSPDLTAGIIAVVTAGFALFNRTQTSPLPSPSLRTGWTLAA